MPTRNLSGKVWTPLIRKVILHSQDRRGAASIRYRNRAEITVLVSEQKPYPVQFSSSRKSYPVVCERSLTGLVYLVFTTHLVQRIAYENCIVTIKRTNDPKLTGLITRIATPYRWDNSPSHGYPSSLSQVPVQARRKGSLLSVRDNAKQSFLIEKTKWSHDMGKNKRLSDIKFILFYPETTMTSSISYSCLSFFSSFLSSSSFPLYQIIACLRDNKTGRLMGRKRGM